MTLDGFKRRTKVSHALLRVIKEFNRIERENRRYGTGRELFFAEIHMIQFIKNHEGLHISSVAEKLGITKGAVSQIARKLQNKGMLIKETDSTNQRRVLLRLTREGEKAYSAHEAMHEELEREIEGILSGSSDREREFLGKFLETLEERLSSYR